MNTAEWPLAVFTLVVQMAAGMMVLSELARMRAGAAAKRLFAGRDIVCFALGAVGMLISLAHLGNPLHSPFTIFHLGQSWLSREVLCTGLFVATLAVLVAVRVFPPLTRTIPFLARLVPLITVLSCLAGLATVYAMARVYMLVTVPAWNSPSTLLNFFGAAFLLGSLGIGLLASVNWTVSVPADEKGPGNWVIATILLGLALGLGLKFAEIPFDLLAGAQHNARGESILTILSDIGMPVFALRLVLPVLASALFLRVLIPAFKRDGNGLSAPLAVFALFFGMAGEFLGRLIFYSTHILMGL
ncbi:dimethyl sulfoxide reductase anchor subunit family protein [Telmatospirillum siberiense]|uniref:DMSO reductase n=1 Tax=Telmatospirillum siberiense TaxID=382514 RepID=A0A2N3Q1L3_9PROT|nr:DmsC/YnfH family molybdoenzyme membrane anchor subunit [Telmatospirillum siberiense]PKU26549.1 hypothetical protein CWS72_01525 [Telmatospirillum siberiense]